jgi:hypothetical protein
MTSAPPPSNMPPPKPLISQVEQVTAPWIEGIQGVAQDSILKQQTPPKQPGK